MSRSKSMWPLRPPWEIPPRREAAACRHTSGGRSKGSGKQSGWWCDRMWYYVILCDVILCNILWYSDSCTRTHICIYIYAYTVCHSLQDLQTKPASAWLCVYIDITRHWICYLRTCMFPPMARPHMQAIVSKGHIPTPGLTQSTLQSRWWWPHGVYIYIYMYYRESRNHDKSW